MAVETDRPVVDCINEAANVEMENIPNDHYLNKNKYM